MKWLFLIYKLNVLESLFILLFWSQSLIIAIIGSEKRNLVTLITRIINKRSKLIPWSIPITQNILQYSPFLSQHFFLIFINIIILRANKISIIDILDLMG